MNLFDKIDVFYKKAQEALGVAPTVGPAPQLIRDAAKSALIKLISNPEVPMEEKKDFNKLGDILRDFLNKRYVDSDLEHLWASYLTSLMNKANKLTLGAETQSLGSFYQSLYETFSATWDKIHALPQYQADKASKPLPVANLGAAKTETYEPGEKQPDITDVYNKNIEEKMKPGGGLSSLKTSRKDRLRKLAALTKRL